MRLNQLCETMIDFLPDFIRHYRFKRRLGNFDRQIHFATVTDVDDHAVWIASVVHRASANEKTCNLFDRSLRCRQTDPLK